MIQERSGCPPTGNMAWPCRAVRDVSCVPCRDVSCVRQINRGARGVDLEDDTSVARQIPNSQNKSSSAVHQCNVHLWSGHRGFMIRSQILHFNARLKNRLRSRTRVATVRFRRRRK